MNLGKVTELGYAVPASTVGHLVTGLEPNAGYAVTLDRAGDEVRVTVRAGGDRKADEGGVLTF
jgi:hypothetical protein